MTDTMADAAQRMVARGGAAGLWRSPAAKFFAIGLITFLLTIPLFMVLALTGDRSERRADVVASIGREWGAAQTVGGPVLVVPFSDVIRSADGRNDRTVVRHLAILPESLTVKADAATETRSVAIYAVPVYSAKVAIAAHFAAVDPAGLGVDPASIAWDKAYLAFRIGDLSGIEDAALTVDGQTAAVEPGFSADGDYQIAGLGAANWAGLHIPFTKSNAPAAFDVGGDVRLRGTEALRFAPLGRKSEVQLTSNWAHPNFAIGMLPSERSVSDAGFAATWRVPYLARSQPQVSVIESWGANRIDGDLVGVGLVEPVDLYALVERALKYGVMFIGVTFMAVFLLEVFSPRRVHIVQYCLVGMVVVMFFVLLLALAEQIGFGPAYLTASAATTAVIAGFVGLALAGGLRALIATVVLGATFALLYAILTMEDFALLAGAVAGFVAVAGVLFATRRVDWSGTQRSAVPEAR